MAAVIAALDAGQLGGYATDVLDEEPPPAGHAFNNLIDGAENATISVMSAATLVEACYYRDCALATTFSHASDSVSKGQGGSMRIVNSRNVEPRAKPAADTEREAFEIEHNFKDSGEPSQFQFNEPADWKWTDLHQVPYPHQADSADDVPTLVRKYAGTGKLSDPEQRPSRRRPLPHFQ